MAKKQKTDADKQPSRATDRHASPFMIRLPEEFRAQLARHKQKTRVPMTAAVQIALEEFLAKHGLWPPEAGDDDKPAARRKN